MQIHPHPLWWLRIATFSLAALAAASASYWVLKWVAMAPSGQALAVVFPSPDPTDPQAVARLLGGGQVGAPLVQPVIAAPSRFKLTGVVAGPRQQGYALISIDGQPAQPFRVGAPVGDALVLQSVTTRGAALAASLDAPKSLSLELPKLAQP